MSFYITDSDGNGHYTDFTFSAPSKGLVNKHVLNIISTHNGSQFNEEFASFRKDVVSVLQSQQQAINLMMDSLGLNKPKENPDGK